MEFKDEVERIKDEIFRTIMMCYGIYQVSNPNRFKEVLNQQTDYLLELIKEADDIINSPQPRKNHTH